MDGNALPWCLISLLQHRNLPPPPFPALGAPHGLRWQDCLRTLFLACLILCTQLWRLSAPGPRLTKHHPFMSHPNAVLRQCHSCPWQQPRPLKANSMLSFRNTWENLWNMQNLSVCRLLNIPYFSFKHHFFSPGHPELLCYRGTRTGCVTGQQHSPRERVCFRSRQGMQPPLPPTCLPALCCSLSLAMPPCVRDVIHQTSMSGIMEGSHGPVLHPLQGSWLLPHLHPAH